MHVKFKLFVIIIFLLAIGIFFLKRPNNNTKTRDNNDIIYQIRESLPKNHVIKNDSYVAQRNFSQSEKLTSTMVEYPKNFFVNAMQVADLNNDGQKEIVYKEREKLFIVDKNWQKQYECLAGNSANLMDNILIDDIYNNGEIEIVSAGKIENSGKYSLKFFDSKCNLLSQYPLSNYEGETQLILAKNLDNDVEKEVIVYSDYTLQGVFLLDNGKIEKTNKDDVAKLIIDELNKKRTSPIDNEIIKKFNLEDAKVYVDDINGDKINEIIALISEHIGTAVGPQKILILKSTNGDVLWQHNFPAPNTSVEIADIDNDGFKEIITAGFSDGPFTIFNFSSNKGHANNSSSPI